MTPSEYLDAAKARMGISSDYELAKRWDMPSANLPGIRSGKRHVPLDVAYRIAITVDLDPAQVVADLESQREKNAKRAEFWRSFTSRARLAASVLLCTLVWNFSNGHEAAPAGAGFGRRRCA